MYRRFGPAVYRRARSLLKNTEEARDVTQEAFIAIVKRLDRVKSESEGFALLYQIATFNAISRLRWRRRWSRRLAQGFATDVGPSAASEKEARRIEVAIELAQLTRGELPRTLAVAVLHFVDDRKVTEVSKELALSPKTVRRLLDRFVTRARKRSTRFETRPE